MPYPIFQGHEKISQTQISSKVQKQNHGAASRKGLSTNSHLTSDSVWSKIKEFAKYKYQVLTWFLAVLLSVFKFSV
jgi:hypothetical protein